MAINQAQLRGLFRKRLVSLYVEQTRPTQFLKSFFPSTFSRSKFISIEAQRGSEKVALDVDRLASNGNRNTYSRSSEKVFMPPLYWEYSALTDSRIYDYALGSQDPQAIEELAQEHAREMAEKRYKIERAFEKQCAEVIEDGVIQLDSTSNMDFFRKASSKDTSSDLWTNSGTANPGTDIKECGDFLRKEGKYAGGVLNVILGADALTALKQTDWFNNQADLRNARLADIQMPQAQTEGNVLHGELGAGDYVARLWSYPQYYEDSNGTLQKYLSDNKIYVLPEQPNFSFNFALVPQLMDAQGNIPQGPTDEFMMFDYIDQRSSAHEMHIKSAAMAMPIAVDQIKTRQVV